MNNASEIMEIIAHIISKGVPAKFPKKTISVEEDSNVLQALSTVESATRGLRNAVLEAYGIADNPSQQSKTWDTYYIQAHRTDSDGTKLFTQFIVDAEDCNSALSLVKQVIATHKDYEKYQICGYETYAIDTVRLVK